jgi:hypothetical protein
MKLTTKNWQKAIEATAALRQALVAVRGMDNEDCTTLVREIAQNARDFAELWRIQDALNTEVVRRLEQDARSTQTGGMK